jgi:cell division transport system permease protein
VSRRRAAAGPRRPDPIKTAAPGRAATAGAAARPAVLTLLARHAQGALYSLGQLARTPLSTLLTAAVIGIALALPTGLHLLLSNAQQLTAGWDASAHVSLFLKQGVGAAEAENTAATVRARPDVAEVQYLSPDDALAEFRQLSGFGDALDALDQNPLPSVLVVRPAASLTNPGAVSALVETLRTLPAVEVAQLDVQWVKRLYAIMEIGRRGVLVLASLLSLAVLLIVGNTIRLAIQNRRSEIEIMKLIGGTDAFIRRPFLYTGIWFGTMGGAIAWALVNVSLWALEGPVLRLAELYGSSFRLAGLDLAAIAGLLGIGTLLGLSGAGIAVGRHLRAIEPA